jgi:hypothetical protein
MRLESRLLLPTRHSIFGSIVSSLEEMTMANFVVSHLPEKIHSGLSFFEACLEEKVIVVPGEHSGPDVIHRADIASQDSSSTSTPRTAAI